jgi:hypothetical protein
MDPCGALTLVTAIDLDRAGPIWIHLHENVVCTKCDAPLDLAAAPGRGRPWRCRSGGRRPRLHLLNGLYDAKLDKGPVVALIAQQHRSALGSTYQQEIDARTLFKDVCSAYLQMVTVPEQLLLVVDRAVRTATIVDPAVPLLPPALQPQ